jgi:hypothetical protein
MRVQAPARHVPVKKAEAAGEKAAQSKGVELLARAGFIARGVIYGVIGILAVKLAVGPSWMRESKPLHCHHEKTSWLTIALPSLAVSI